MTIRTESKHGVDYFLEQWEIGVLLEQDSVDLNAVVAMNLSRVLKNHFPNGYSVSVSYSEDSDFQDILLMADLQIESG